MKTIEARVEDPGAAGTRLDVYISDRMGLFSRSQAKSRISEVRVNGDAARLSRKLKIGDVVSVDYSEAAPMDALPEDIPLDILFENEDVIVVNKPQGMVVHPGSGNHSGTLVNALLHHYGELGKAFGSGELRPGIVHRLDKETSGVIMTAKNPRAHEFLSAQFKSRGVRKRYLAVTAECPVELEGKVETYIARDPYHRKLFICTDGRGKLAATFYTVLRSYTAPAPTGRGRQAVRRYCFISLRPRTGRTHQLRVHMKHIGAPILGDPLYGKPDPVFPNSSLMLHAHRLSILLPGEDAPTEFMAPLPERFMHVLRELQSFSPR
jgi:23S rRNA pseudouridine1911/1915/1917 synthase